MKRSYPWLREHEGYVTLEIRVQPRSSRNLVLASEDGLKVKLQAAPVDGEANEALIDFLRKALKVSRQRILILHGEKGRTKTLKVLALDGEEILAKLGLVDAASMRGLKK